MPDQPWDAWPDTGITVRTAVGRVIIAVEDIWQVVTTAEAARYLGQLLIAAAAQADDTPKRRRTPTSEPQLDPPPETAPDSRRNLIRPEQVAERLHLSLHQLRTMRRDGTGPAFMQLSGHTIRYHPDDIDEWIQELPTLDEET